MATQNANIPAYMYYSSNADWQKQTNDSKYWKQTEKENEKIISDVTSKDTNSEGKVDEPLPWWKATIPRFRSMLNTGTGPSQSHQTAPSPDNKSDGIKGVLDGGTPPVPPEQKNNLFQNLLSSVSKNGLWEDYSGPDRSFRTKGSDGKVKYDWGAGAMNTLGNVSKYGAMAMSFVKDKEMANNTVNDAATSVRKTAQQVLLSTGNPIAMAIGAGSMLSDKVGGTASATKGLGTGNDIGNFLASQVPFLGFLGKNMGKQFQSDELAGSSMYAWNSTADGLFGGKIIAGKGRAENLTQTNNMQRSMATNILRDAKLNFIGAQDPRYYMAAQNELNGGYDQVGRAKQGAILQFTKRTLSKKKYQIGGQIEQTPNGNFEIHLNRDRNLNELVDYVEQQNPLFWERMSGKDKNYIVNPDGSFSSLLMAWSTDEKGNAIVFPLVQYNDSGELQIFSEDEAFQRAIKNKDYVIMSPEEAEDFTSNYKDSEKLKHIYKDYQNYINEFKEGGKVNVIPEGALHKNKHHLEEVDEKFEDVTTKGIPVIVESEGGEVIQQAEVEREEIIFRLEVTKKLEELSKEHTDEAAIEAGKLLVQEILYNTIDNTQGMI